MKNKVTRFLTSVVLLALSGIVFSLVINAAGISDNVQSNALKFSSVLFAVGFVAGIAGITAKSKGLAFSDGFVISDTTYAGEAAGGFIVKAITGADTIQGGHVMVKDGIKKKFTIPRWDANYEDFIQDRQATPITKGSFTVDGATLTPADYMIYTEFNPRDFEDHWEAVRLNATLIDRSLPVTAESVTVQEVLKRHTKYLNKMMWNGDTTTTGIYKYFNGYVPKILASSDYISVGTGNYAGLTSANIIAKMKLAYDAIPDALKYDPNMKFFMNYTTYNLFDEAQKNQTYKGVDFTQSGVPMFYGREVVKIADMPANTFVVAKGMATMESNLWLGMNSIQDANIQLSRLQANSELWFIKMLMKVDVQIGFMSEVVLYHPSMS